MWRSCEQARTAKRTEAGGDRRRREGGSRQTRRSGNAPIALGRCSICGYIWHRRTPREPPPRWEPIPRCSPPQPRISRGHWGPGFGDSPASSPASPPGSGAAAASGGVGAGGGSSSRGRRWAGGQQEMGSRLRSHGEGLGCSCEEQGTTIVWPGGCRQPARVGRAERDGCAPRVLVCWQAGKKRSFEVLSGALPIPSPSREPGTRAANHAHILPSLPAPPPCL